MNTIPDGFFRNLQIIPESFFRKILKNQNFFQLINLFFQVASNKSDAEVQTEIPLHHDNFMFEYDVKDVKPFVKQESEF